MNCVMLFTVTMAMVQFHIKYSKIASNMVLA